MPYSVLVIRRFLILSRKPIGTALGSSCLKSGTGKTSLLRIFMIGDQSKYSCLHHNTLFYAFISHILTFSNFLIFPSWGVASLGIWDTVIHGLFSDIVALGKGGHTKGDYCILQGYKFSDFSLISDFFENQENLHKIYQIWSKHR